MRDRAVVPPCSGDVAVNDAPFSVMELVGGVVLDTSADAECELDRAARAAVSSALTDVLAGVMGDRGAQHAEAFGDRVPRLGDAALAICDRMGG